MKYLSPSDVRILIEQQCARAGGQSAWAEASGISPQYICDVLRRNRPIGRKIARALDLERVVCYVQKRSK